MSTKIYQAYRCPVSKINQLIDWAHDKMYAKVLEYTRDLMALVEIKEEIPDHIKGDSEGEAIWRSCKQMQKVLKAVEEAAKSPYKDDFDLECGLNIWLDDKCRKAYIVPIGPAWVTSVLNDTAPDWLENYCYWNNSDEPEGFTRGEWKKRGRQWDKICTGSGKADHNARRMYHSVVETNSSGLSELKMDLGWKEMWDWNDRQAKKAQKGKTGEDE